MFLLAHPRSDSSEVECPNSTQFGGPVNFAGGGEFLYLADRKAGDSGDFGRPHTRFVGVLLAHPALARSAAAQMARGRLALDRPWNDAPDFTTSDTKSLARGVVRSTMPHSESTKSIASPASVVYCGQS
jgi:hypothetical protein